MMVMAMPAQPVGREMQERAGCEGNEPGAARFARVTKKRFPAEIPDDCCQPHNQ